MKMCAACQGANPPEANFCILCRAPFERAKGAYCDKGHAMHPSWTECLECRGERSQVQDFGSEPARAPTVLSDDHSVLPSSRQYTVIEVSPPVIPQGSLQTTAAAVSPSRVAKPSEPSVSAAPLRVKTVFGTAPQAAAPAAPGPPVRVPGNYSGIPVGAPPPPSETEKRTERRIVGILLTYTWRPEGQIFPIREGRNRIGRSNECEISLPEDSHLSGLNSHITYRKNFTIGDLVSMGGTDLNGEPVEENYVKLPNYAQIRAGSTHFTFIAVDPATGAV